MSKVDKDYFISRCTRIYDLWKGGQDETLSKLESLVFMVGTSEDYCKSQSLQTWLFNCGLLDTLLILTKTRIYFLGSEKKAQYLSPLLEPGKENFPPVTLMNRDKASKDKNNIAELMKVLKDNGSSYGCFLKESSPSEFGKAWAAAIEESGLTAVDVSLSFALLFAIKDDKEISYIKKSAEATCNAWISLRKKLVEIVDTDKKVKHKKVADDLEKTAVTPQVQGSLAKSSDILETCYTPIIQSGSQCNLKFSATSNDQNMVQTSMAGCLGMRYMNYCTNVARTMMVQPSNNVEQIYELFLEAETHLIGKLKAGAILGDVYRSTIDFFKTRKADLLPYIVKNNFGFGTGIEFRDSHLLINDKCKQVVQPNMVFVISLGLQNYPGSAGKGDNEKATSIWLSDTVLVAKEGPTEVLTMAAKSRFRSNSIRFKDAVDEKPEVPTLAEQGRSKRSVILQEQTRHKQTNEEKRKEHQKELAEQLNEAAKARLAHKPEAQDSPKVKKSNISYKSQDKFPNEPEINDNLIYVDKRHDTVVLPIFGMPVPLHISMLKNTSIANEEEYTYLRINFTHPGSQIGKDNLLFPNPLADFVKELTFRSSNAKEPGEMHAPSLNLQTAYRLIKEMQKRFRTMEAEEREKEGAVKQDKLIVNNMKGNPKLKDLYVRPNIVAKRMSGVLEAHANGFRYTTPRGDKIDVLYNNIKHAFFQPCDNEMIILLHFNLKNPVLWGKKKYTDIQFFTEVGEITTDLGKYHHMQDRDDIASEQMEREMRKKLNATFQNFCDKVNKATNESVDFDTPFNDLAFNGVPYRSAVSLKPTSSCLVNLTEWPPFVITLDEVELVHFERVTGNTRSFDMIIVFKDYTRPTQAINHIPGHMLDNVKDWLNSCDIRYSEGAISLNWKNIMKTIVDDPDNFFEEGGWQFLHAESDAEDEEEESEESEFAPSDDSDGSGDDESETDSEEAQSTSESESEAELDSDESSGKEWSDLEDEAAEADRQKERGEREEQHRPTKRKHVSGHGSHGGSSAKKRR